MYIVLRLAEEKPLKVPLFTSKPTVTFKWADGMVGVVPVFETYEQALEYADGDTRKIIGGTKCLKT
jgi:hypothetical protein